MALQVTEFIENVCLTNNFLVIAN